MRQLLLEVFVGFMALVGTILSFLMFWLTYRMSKRDQQASKERKVVAEKLEVVNEDQKAANEVVDKKLDTIVKTGQAVHKLVNNKTAVLLREKAEDRERLAKMTGTPADQEMAMLARRDYNDHQNAQALIDAQVNNP